MMPPDINDKISEEEIKSFSDLGQVGWKYLCNCIFKSTWNKGLETRILYARRYTNLREFIFLNESDNERANKMWFKMTNMYNFDHKLMNDFDNFHGELKALYELRNLRLAKI